MGPSGSEELSARSRVLLLEILASKTSGKDVYYKP
jgi:hypothetical protein